MPCASHHKVDAHQEGAAKAHHGAAKLHEKGDRTVIPAKSADAKCCCGTAQKAADDTHEKSALQAET